MEMEAWRGGMGMCSAEEDSGQGSGGREGPRGKEKGTKQGGKQAPAC